MRTSLRVDWMTVWMRVLRDACRLPLRISGITCANHGEKRRHVTDTGIVTHARGHKGTRF